MKRILLLGAGKIGSLISTLLARSADYDVFLADSDRDAVSRACRELSHPALHPFPLDATDRDALARYLSANEIDAIVSALPYYCNPGVSSAARAFGKHYFDITEDVEVTRSIIRLSEGAEKAFVPQCGLAPGFISIVANEYMTHFERLESVKLRVGALPVHPSNALKYSLTWSTNGLINEYGNVCYGIENGTEVALLPLEGYETIEVDGLLYEAFNTSGGLGTLADTYNGRVGRLNYKTLRYPGHCEKIHFLMQDLKLNEDRETLRRILENAVPKTLQDVVVIFVSVTGTQKGELYEENYLKKIYPQVISERLWSAIQVTTASAVSAVVDIVLQNESGYHGFVTQESIGMSTFLANRFGSYYK